MFKKDAFRSKYLKLVDVPVYMPVTIKRVRLEVIGVGEDASEKAVVEFMEPHIKPLILNSGNWDVIESAYGGNSDNWGSKRIVIYPDPNVMYKGQRVGGLRVRIPVAKKQPAASVTPPEPEDVPDPYDEELIARADS